MAKIKVMIVDDSAFMRKVVQEILGSNDEIEVVAKARNGKEALEKLQRHRIDVITMDVEMPEMNGLETLEEIMKTKPTPVVMLSSYTKRGTMETLESLEMGAVDFMPKPSNMLHMDISQLQKELVEKVLTAATAKLSGYRPVRMSKIRSARGQAGIATKVNNIIAIGTSTGGPRALQEVLPVLPGSIDGTVLVVQHMPPGFTRSLADRLDTLCQIRVKEAEEGEIARPGYCYIAPGDYHMRLGAGSNPGEYVIRLGRDEMVSGHRPSVDVLFESICDVKADSIIAVVMTGMGSDGTKGVARLKRSLPCYTIAQDEETSVVFGMPKSAIRQGYIDRVAALGDIGGEILKRLEVL